MRNIVKATGGHVTGITINEYQVGRCKKLNKEAGVADLTEIVQGNFMDVSKVFKANTFDGAYAIEAACHDPTLLLCTRRFSRFSNLALSSRRTNGCALRSTTRTTKFMWML